MIIESFNPILGPLIFETCKLKLPQRLADRFLRQFE